MSLLEMKSISKAFGGARALTKVDFSVERGEIHALLGENGAGKSTLMNILTGVAPMDAGIVIFNGKTYLSPSIRQMEQAGIAFVPQERNVVNDLTVYENIFLNRELRRGPLLDKKAMINRTRALFDQLDVNIDPLETVSALKTSEKQLLEICRALYSDAQLFILDEPTTALSNDEVDHLFKILSGLKGKEKSFVFISHKMTEIFRISDRYTVLRNGSVISTGLIKDITPRQITQDMVGAQYVDRDGYTARPLGGVVLSLRNFSGKGFRNVNLDIKKGEILAFTGLAGSGASEVIQAMFGVQPAEGGYMEVKGKRVSGRINGFMRSGIAMLPSNRNENSVIPDMNILENICIAEYMLSQKKPFIFKKTDIGKYNAFRDMLRIKAETPFDSISALSGGNQQKAFLARWLNIGADILFFDNPTQGVDVGAKAEIYKLILEFASEGKTIVINTLEIPEIKKVSDRCAVFYEGEIIKIFEHDQIDEHDVMLYSTNAINALGV